MESVGALIVPQRLGYALEREATVASINNVRLMVVLVDDKHSVDVLSVSKDCVNDRAVRHPSCRASTRCVASGAVVSQQRWEMPAKFLVRRRVENPR